MQGKASPDKLKVGGRFKHIRVVAIRNGQMETRSRKGTVTDIYPHIFRAKMDGHNYYECFSLELLETGVPEYIKPL